MEHENHCEEFSHLLSNALDMVEMMRRYKGREGPHLTYITVCFKKYVGIVKYGPYSQRYLDRCREMSYFVCSPKTHEKKIVNDYVSDAALFVSDIKDVEPLIVAVEDLSDVLDEKNVIFATNHCSFFF